MSGWNQKRNVFELTATRAEKSFGWKSLEEFYAAFLDFFGGDPGDYGYGIDWGNDDHTFVCVYGASFEGDAVRLIEEVGGA